MKQFNLFKKETTNPKQTLVQKLEKTNQKK